jgi:ABC-type glutathione transport system ATPase component
MSAPASGLVQVEGLVVDYGTGARAHRAVDDVGFDLEAGTTLALVGESGAGKSTVGKVITGLHPATSGRVVVCGEDRTRPATSTRDRRRRAKQLQVVPQDPFVSIDPRQLIGAVLTEALTAQGSSTRRSRRAIESRVHSLLEQVGLTEQHAQVTPRQMSGGQLQRVAIARALAVEPAVVVLDEAVSALDVSVQAQVLNLLIDLQRRTGVAYLFITHDLSVVRQVADDVLVLRSGRVIEHGDTDQVLTAPVDDYTKLLIASTPQPGWKPVARASLVPADG